MRLAMHFGHKHNRMFLESSLVVDPNVKTHLVSKLVEL